MSEFFRQHSRKLVLGETVMMAVGITVVMLATRAATPLQAPITSEAVAVIDTPMTRLESSIRDGRVQPFVDAKAGLQRVESRLLRLEMTLDEVAKTTDKIAKFGEQP